MSMTHRELISKDPWSINGKTFTSRLLVGTGKYSTNELMADCLEASGCEIVTVALRRVPLGNKGEKNLLDYLDLKRMTVSRIGTDELQTKARETIKAIIAEVRKNQKLPAGIEINIGYNGRYLADGKVIHAGSMEVRASF